MKVLGMMLCFLIAFNCSGQTSENIRMSKRHGVVLTGAGPGLYGSISYDYFISPKIDIEIGAGPLTLFGGVRYHFEGDEDKNWTPYVGGYVIYIWILEIFDDDDNEAPLAFYMPIGLQYIGKNGFSFAAEFAGMYGVGEFIEWGGIKLGYRF